MVFKDKLGSGLAAEEIMCAKFIEALGFPIKCPGWIHLSALLTGLSPQKCGAGWEGSCEVAVSGGVVAGVEVRLSELDQWTCTSVAFYTNIWYSTLIPCLVESFLQKQW